MPSSVLFAPWIAGRLLARDCRGVAAVEFALISTPMIIILIGLFDLSNGWITWRRVSTSAEAVGQVATMLAVQPNTTNMLTYNDAWRASTAVFAVLPKLATAPLAEYSVVLTEVTFTTDKTCNNTSTYTDYCHGKVLWSKTFQGSGQARPCVYLTRVANASTPSTTTLPFSAFQANPVLIVDVAYTFHPLFLNGFVGAVPMSWMAYFPSRSGLSVPDQTILYNDPSAQCP